MINDVIAKLNDFETLTKMAFSASEIEAKEVVLRVIIDELPQMIETLEKVERCID